MNRQYVIDNNLVDRYLFDQLIGDEKTEFETYYLSCAETQDELVVTEKMIQGFDASSLSGRGRQRYAPLASVPVEPKRAPERPWQLASVAASLAAFIAIGFNVIGNKAPVFDQTVDINVPILSLGATRGVGPARLIDLPKFDVRVAVALDLGLASFPTYRVELIDQKQNVVWSADELVPDQHASLTFALPPGLLTAGGFEFVARASSDSTVALRVPVLVRIDLDDTL